MVNLELLNEAIRRSGKTKAEIARYIKMDESTFYRKMGKNGSKFTVEQAGRLAEAINLSADEAQDIFFAKTLA